MTLRGCLVLGMHRSGTSAVAGALSRMGLAACRADDAVRGPWNPAGHFESRSLMALDDRLLGEMGCRWWAPPPAGPGYAERAACIETTPREARRVFRRSYPRRGWVWKDPRACLLVPFWRRALGAGVGAVVVVRNPLEVAESLERRNETSVAFGLALWERYNRLVLSHAVGMPVWITRFDDLVTDPARWVATAERFAAGLGLRVRPPGGTAEEAGVVDRALRHGAHGRADLRSWPGALALHDALESVVGVWEQFVAPELPVESPDVQAQLDVLGPDRRPSWRPPPGAPQERNSHF